MIQMQVVSAVMFGNHWARLSEEAFLFSLWEKHFKSFLRFHVFEMSGIIMYHYASFKERETEEVRVTFYCKNMRK